MRLRLGTRGSRLALFQAELVKARLEDHSPGIEVEIRILQTTGDRITDLPLAKIGDKGLFTKELDRAILDDEIDAAVHSLKDMPTVLVEGLVLTTILDREDPRDILVPAPGRPRSLGELPEGARIGTSSLRRRAQLRNLRPDLVVEDLRGNLDTRFRKLREGDLDAAILAHAGVARLGNHDLIGEVLDVPEWLPAPGQGALGIASHADAPEIARLLSPLDDHHARVTTTAERAFLRALEGGCQIPIGAFASLDNGDLHLYGLVAALDGDPVIRGEATGRADEPEEIGVRLADELLRRGADRVLSQIRTPESRDVPRITEP